MSKTALITGITGQDGAYLAEYLVMKFQYPNHKFQTITNIQNSITKQEDVRKQNI